jgi:leucyl/phenylalanyl-tRNA---protein transferase
MLSPGSSTLLPEVVLLGYRNGYFPMADPDLGKVLWHRPEIRAIIPLDTVRIPRSLRQVLNRGTFSVTFNAAFDAVIQGCADREDTWISDEIIDTYTQLHHLGYAHSVESWFEGDLVGGLYGVSIGAAFFGESMYSVKSNASKVAFAHLVARLQERGYRLLDTQYINDFTESLGAIEIPDTVYQLILADALSVSCSLDDAEV